MHSLRFYQIIFKLYLSHEEKTKINRKEAGIGPYFKKNLGKLSFVGLMFPTFHLIPSSVTRLGSFLKFLETNFVLKVAPKYVTYRGYFEKHHFCIKTDVANFLD